MSSTRGPLLLPRFGALALSGAFGVIAASMALNALIESNKNVNELKKLAPMGATLDISIKDVRGAGAGAAAGSVLLALLSGIFMLFIMFSPTLSLRTLRVQAIGLVFSVIIIIASMIPYLIFFTKRGPKVTAFLGGQQLPDSLVKPLVASKVGSKAFYKNIDYLRLLAIFPWVAIFFGLVAAAILFKTASSTTAVVEEKHTPETTEKSSSSVHEVAEKV